MTDLFQIAAGLLPQAGLEMKQTLKQDRMKCKKIKTRKNFPLILEILEKAIKLCYFF